MAADTAGQKKKLSDAMEILGLRCEPDRLQKPLYCAQALVRLFRKLYTAGRKEMGVTFHHGLMEEDYCYISRHTYFPQLKERIRRERNAGIQELIKSAGYSGSISKDDIVLVKTKVSGWTFDLSGTSLTLWYVTQTFYKGVRERHMVFDKNVSLEEKVQEILQEIGRTDRRFQAGVGSQEITLLVERIADLEDKAGFLAIKHGI